VPTREWYDIIHNRLLDCDPTAPAELVQNVLDHLVKRLTQTYYYISDSELITDAVTDALISYVKNPNQFNSTKRGLLGYLEMAAEGDLKNALAKARRRQEKETPTEDVELVASVRNIGEEPGADEIYEHSEMVSQLMKMLGDIFVDPIDRRAAELILEGERSAARFGELYGLQDLRASEQRREVKRRKDRIKKRIERHAKGSK
jgi:hypothetical protein